MAEIKEIICAVCGTVKGYQKGDGKTLINDDWVCSKKRDKE